ncbi:MAG TPA: HD domain-containing phosphohydrolase [Azonexus sp.]|nr:HD domain-containing phosphohydrolase [Azonexus sp.]
MAHTAPFQPSIPSRSALLEFSEALAYLIPQVERQISELRCTPADREIVAALFRGLHTIKGDAAMCGVGVGVTIVHPAETLLSRIREGEFAFSEPLAEVMLLALDRLEASIGILIEERSLALLRLPELIGGLERLAISPAARMDVWAADLLERITGFRPSSLAVEIESTTTAMPENRDEDMMFFLGLALHFEAFTPLFQGRSGRLLNLALRTNMEAGMPVDQSQLEAAIYMHDVGMMFLPESVWLKVGRIADDDLARLRRHPDQAAGLLARTAGWSEAANMVAQHHEMQDGGGYPRGLKGGEICPGAKILAIIDAFEAITLKQSHRGQTRSLVRAIAEINACDNQFDPHWIAHFNRVIRNMLET